MIRRMGIWLDEKDTMWGETTYNSHYPIHRDDSCRGYPVYPSILVCPMCFRLWCQMKWLPPEGITELHPKFEPHAVQATICADCFRFWPQHLHPDLNPVGGSLLDSSTMNGYDVGLLQALPEPLLRREFELTLSSYEALICQYPQFPLIPLQNNPAPSSPA
jgi:hypothetical protein